MVWLRLNSENPKLTKRLTLIYLNPRTFRATDGRRNRHHWQGFQKYWSIWQGPYDMDHITRSIWYGPYNTVHMIWAIWYGPFHTPWKNLPYRMGRIQTLLLESVKFLNFGKLLWSCDSPIKVSPMLKIWAPLSQRVMI